METVGGVAHTRNCKWTDGRPGVQYKVIRAFGRIKKMQATLVHFFCNTLLKMSIAVCSNETVYAVPVHITVCVFAQPIYTVYVRVRFFSADTTASCTE